jgi:hypothetical protein
MCRRDIVPKRRVRLEMGISGDYDTIKPDPCMAGYHFVAGTALAANRAGHPE